MITLQRVAKAVGKHATRGWFRFLKLLGAPRQRHCPACDRDVVGFFRYGAEAEWGCPECLSSPRERLMNHWLDTGLLEIPNGAVLHMAPNERSLVQRFSAKAQDYVPADLDPSRYTVSGVVQVDLMTIAEKGRFDRIYASHVMEHVPDDAQVLANLFAALRPGGEAWLIVPLWDKPTEDGSYAIPPRERERRFGQWDHVRHYGPDFADRIRATGFDLDLLKAEDVPGDVRHRAALSDIVFRARKPALGG